MSSQETGLHVITRRQFNGITLDCYKSGQDGSDFWATREQVGALLGYENPRKAIKKIHNRNRERLDKFSTLMIIGDDKGGPQNDTPLKNPQSTTVYNFKGLLEICRYSNQPKADKVIDFLWDIADEIRRHSMYLTDKAAETLKNDPEKFNALMAIYLAEKEANKKLREQINSNRAYTLIGQMVTALPGGVTVKDAAGFLSQKGIPMGQNRLFKRLRNDGWICSRKGKQRNKPTQRALERGLLNLEINGGMHTITVVTPEGLKYLSKLLTAENYPMSVFFDDEEEQE